MPTWLSVDAVACTLHDVVELVPGGVPVDQHGQVRLVAVGGVDDLERQNKTFECYCGFRDRLKE